MILSTKMDVVEIAKVVKLRLKHSTVALCESTKVVFGWKGRILQCTGQRWKRFFCQKLSRVGTVSTVTVAAVVSLIFLVAAAVDVVVFVDVRIRVKSTWS